MPSVIILDSAPLGHICNPKNREDFRKLREFIRQMGFALRVPEIIDYELRRNFELAGLYKSISLLNQFRQRDQIIPITSEDLILAADIWAECRKQGRPPTENKGIDIDVILVSQAFSQRDIYDQVVILTVDIGDLSTPCAHYGLSLWDWKSSLADCDSGNVVFI